MSTAAASFVRSADGTRLAYRRRGQGPPVLVVHGGMGSSVGWGAVAARLSREFEVFLVDRRGRGLSEDDGRPHSLQREVEDVEALLAITGPGTTLLGHSFGGAVTLETVRAAKPGSVGALIVYEPAIGLAGAIESDVIERMQTLLDEGDAAAMLDVGIAALDVADLVSADPRPTGFTYPAPALALAPTVPRELRAVTQPGLPPERYAGLELPVLVLLGTTSPAAVTRNCERLAATVSGAQLGRLHDLGHVAHTAAPDVVAEAVRRFLRQPSQAASSSSAPGTT